MSQIRLSVSLLVVTMTMGVLPASAGEPAAASPDDAFQKLESKRNDEYAAQLEAWLRDYLVAQYPDRAAKAWNRDYSSIEAYEKSIERNREAWRTVIKPPTLVVTGEAQRQPHAPLSDLQAQWLTVPMGQLTAEGILAAPPQASPDNRVPLVIVQHGIGSFPERNFGIADWASRTASRWTCVTAVTRPTSTAACGSSPAGSKRHRAPRPVSDTPTRPMPRVVERMRFCSAGVGRNSRRAREMARANCPVIAC